MIAATYVVCNEERLIGDSIRSVKAYVDRIVVLDVAFLSNPQESPHSTDGTRRAAEAAAVGVPLTYIEETEKLSEVDARNGVLSLLGMKDYALIMDGDETLHGDYTSVGELAKWVRSGVFPFALGLSVYTSNILFDGQAPEMKAEEYATLPIVESVGIQPRLFPRKDHQYRLMPPDRTPALHARGGWVGTGQLTSEAIILNHRTRRTFEGYQNAYAWEFAR